MQTYKLRIVPWHAADVHRVIELPGRSTLHDLHGAIQHAFDLDDDHRYAFFMNHMPWAEEFAFGGPGSDFPDATSKKLADLTLKPKKRFLYLFDFGDELTFDVQVAGFGEETRGEPYPRIVESVGEAPPQYPDEEDEVDGDHDHSHEQVSVDAATLEVLSRAKPFVDVRDAKIVESLDALDLALASSDVLDDEPSFDDEDDFEDDDDDESFDEHDEDELVVDLPADRILEEAVLVEQIVARGRGDAALMHHLVSHAVDGDVIGWMLGLPARLHQAGHPARAAEIIRVLLPEFPSDNLAFTLPALLAEAGRKDEALEALRNNLEEFPGESRMLTPAGLAYLELGDDANAEKCFREALGSTGSEWPLRKAIAAELCDIFERQGRHVEITALERSEDAYRARWSGPIPGLPYERAQAKVGRNDPCPCGSGRKYKKCCGAN